MNPVSMLIAHQVYYLDKKVVRRRLKRREAREWRKEMSWQ